MAILDDIEAVAYAAVLAGGEELRLRFREDEDDADYGPHDVKAAADMAAEERMLPVIGQAFPDHAVFAEETGELGGSGTYRWIVDPLDGTNNFAAGLPTFSTSVAVLREGEPVLAVVYQPMTDETYLTRKEAGVSYAGKLVTSDRDVEIEAGTVALIVGRDVPRDMETARQADAIREALDETVKRVIDSWAPTVHSGLFARGRLQGLVQFHPDEEEEAVTELLASESDAVIDRDGSLFVAASDEGSMEALWGRCRTAASG